MGHKTRIMYIERKDKVTGSRARIGRVTFSKTGKTIYYQGRTFERTQGYKANYLETETGIEYWISGCKKSGKDSLYPLWVEIDDDVREEYWRDVRGMPDSIHLSAFQSLGKYRRN